MGKAFGGGGAEEVHGLPDSGGCWSDVAAGSGGGAPDHDLELGSVLVRFGGSGEGKLTSTGMRSNGWKAVPIACGAGATGGVWTTGEEMFGTMTMRPSTTLCTMFGAAFSMAGSSTVVEVSLTHGPAPGMRILDIVRKVLLVVTCLGFSVVELSLSSDCRVEGGVVKA